ncbi:hypothetical protein BH23CHL7_BH23CHL7_00390 [soil metagenome]
MIGLAAAPARSLALAAAPPLLRLIEGGSALNAGKDGRLTILLLGSDARGGGVARTDTIMVASLRGKSISVVSIPRDMARIPNPAGGTFGGKVNGILGTLARGKPTDQALAEFTKVIENLLRVEIDYYALIKFNGFEALVKAVEPIPIRINRAVRDTAFWDDPKKPSGVYFPVSDSYDLYAMQPGGSLCNGEWKSQAEPIASQYRCHRALPFARSRKGKSNSDFIRARRQQDLVLAAVKRVIQRGAGSALSSLVKGANEQTGGRQLWTNVPLTAANALELYDRLEGASVAFQTVFSPPRYGKGVPGSTSFEPDLAAVRQVMAEHFGGSDDPDWTPQPGLAASPAPSPFRPPSASPASSSSPASSPTAGPTDTAAGAQPGLPASSPSAEDPALAAAGPQVAPGSLSFEWAIVATLVVLGFAATALGFYRARRGGLGRRRPLATSDRFGGPGGR